MLKIDMQYYFYGKNLHVLAHHRILTASNNESKPARPIETTCGWVCLVNEEACQHNTYTKRVTFSQLKNNSVGFVLYTNTFENKLIPTVGTMVHSTVQAL
jgi:hypothetical protein